jgi:hypothetical protein
MSTPTRRTSSQKLLFLADTFHKKKKIGKIPLVYYKKYKIENVFVRKKL